jgi:signal transduction histidine kinase
MSELDVPEFFRRARSVHVVRLSANGTIEDCNAAVTHNLGVPRADIVGQPLARFVTDADAARVAAHLAGRDDGVGLRVNFCGSDHLPYTLECWLHLDAEGATLVGEPPLKNDHRMHRDLINVTQDLAVLSRERTKLAEAERHARLIAEAVAREKDRAIATIGHELRQPLGPLTVGLELLKRDSGPERRERAIRAMERQVVQLTRLVEDLLDAARIRENKLVLHREPVDLRQILGELVEAFEPKALQRRIQLQPLMPDARVWVSADVTRLRQVFSNILDNAMKFSDAGGAIAITLSVDDAAARVSLRDNGRGIPENLLPRIFEMFAQQAEGERGGLGIGLAVASGIVAMHDGRIEANSAGAAKGSEFIVHLPVLSQSTAAST